MIYTVFYKDYVAQKDLWVHGRGLFTEEKLHELFQALDDLESLLKREVITSFPFYYTNNDCIEYQNANDLRTALNLKEISEDEAKELFTIDTIGDFPFEQLKETIAEGKERINCLKNDIIIDKEIAKKLVKSYLLLKILEMNGEPIWFGSAIPKEKEKGFAAVKWLLESNAEDLNDLTIEVINKLHKKEQII